MSQMHMPITDAFDSTKKLESVEVELTSKQIEWLERKAEKRGVSLDHMLRSLVTAQIRGVDEGRARPPAGDGAPPSSADRDDEATSDDDTESTTIVESLRSASEQLQDLTEDEEDPDEPELSDTLSRIRSRLEGDSDSGESSSESTSETVLLDDETPSMFDMMEDE